MAERIPYGLFVTGTDTGVGKTQIAAALTRLLAERNLIVRPRKPVESGCRRERDRLVPEDVGTLQVAARTDEPLAHICPYPLESALSPERAAALSGKTLTLDDVQAACLDGVADTDFLLVEGGGILLAVGIGCAQRRSGHGAVPAGAWTRSACVERGY